MSTDLIIGTITGFSIAVVIIIFIGWLDKKKWEKDLAEYARRQQENYYRGLLPSAKKLRHLKIVKDKKDD